MKIVGMVVLAILAFVGAIVGALAVTGNLSAERLSQIFGDDETPAAVIQPTDPIAPVAERLKEEEERLQKWAAELEEREARLAKRESVLDQTLEQTQQLQAEVKAAMDTLDADQAARIEDTAKLVEAMDPQKAAESLASMNPEDAAGILRHIKERTAGRILDELADARQRNVILQTMQERKY